MFSDSLIVSAGEGDYRVEASALFLGEDISASVGGGGFPHIGAVSLGLYEPTRNSATVSTLTVFSHRDDAVSAYFAKAISREMRCTVTVSAGIHIDNASDEDLKKLWSNSLKCCDRLIAELKAHREEL